MPAKTGTISKHRQRLGLSGLTGVRRLKARALAKRVAMLGYRNATSIHYSQKANRWQGIDKKLNGLRGHFPNYADCSSFATWTLWVVLNSHYGLHRDNVNAANWGWGYTGTLVKNGLVVKNRRNWRRGDLIIYGDPFGRTGHVAIYVGRGMVVSHGSEGGPYYVRWDYRTDVHSVRRYI